MQPVTSNSHSKKEKTGSTMNVGACGFYLVLFSEAWSSNFGEGETIKSLVLIFLSHNYLLLFSQNHTEMLDTKKHSGVVTSGWQKSSQSTYKAF